MQYNCKKDYVWLKILTNVINFNLQKNCIQYVGNFHKIAQICNLL